MSLRLAILVSLATLTIGCSNAATEGGQNQDTTLSFPTDDVASALDAGSQNDLENQDNGSVDTANPDTIPTDTGVTPPLEDITPQEDTAIADTFIDDQGQAEDTVPVDTGIDDAAITPDIAPDTGPADDVGDECVPPVPVECDPEGLWTITLVSSAAPGQGCGENGGQGQSESTHTIQVTSTGNGLYKVKMLDPSDGDMISSLQLVGGPNVCKVAFSTTVSVTVPGAGDIEGGTAALVYAYTLTQTNDTFAGPGAVTTSFTTVSGEVMAECTEPLSVEG